MCAVHSAGVEGFSDKLDAFTMALRRAIKDDDVDAARLLRAHTRSVRFDGDLIDLKTFCEQVRKQPFAASVKTPAKRVLDALAVGGDLVVANSTLGPKVERCGGVTAYLPAPTDEISPYYKDLKFAERHGWDEFLRSYQARRPGVRDAGLRILVLRLRSRGRLHARGVRVGRGRRVAVAPGARVVIAHGRIARRGRPDRGRQRHGPRRRRRAEWGSVPWSSRTRA